MPFDAARYPLFATEVAEPPTPRTPLRAALEAAEIALMTFVGASPAEHLQIARDWLIGAEQLSRTHGEGWFHYWLTNCETSLGRGHYDLALYALNVSTSGVTMFGGAGNWYSPAQRERHRRASEGIHQLRWGEERGHELRANGDLLGEDFEPAPPPFEPVSLTGSSFRWYAGFQRSTSATTVANPAPRPTRRARRATLVENRMAHSIHNGGREPCQCVADRNTAEETGRRSRQECGYCFGTGWVVCPVCLHHYVPRGGHACGKCAAEAADDED